MSGVLAATTQTRCLRILLLNIHKCQQQQRQLHLRLVQTQCCCQTVAAARNNGIVCYDGKSADHTCTGVRSKTKYRIMVEKLIIAWVELSRQ